MENVNDSINDVIDGVNRIQPNFQNLKFFIESKKYLNTNISHVGYLILLNSSHV